VSVNQRYDEPWGEPRSGSLQDQWPQYVRGHVVELGAASGRNAVLLPPTSSYVGLERDDALLQRGRVQGLDLRPCDLSRPEQLRAQRDAIASGDTILALDVFEHLLDPAEVIRQVISLAASRHRWIISVPNSVFASARLEILFGRFPRRASGLFDSTHRQFYTWSTFQTHLLSVLGTEAVTLRGTAVPLGGARLARRPLTARAIPLLENLVASLARKSPKLLAYEWLAVVDIGV